MCMFHLIQGLPHVILAQGLRAKIAKACFLFCRVKPAQVLPVHGG